MLRQIATKSLWDRRLAVGLTMAAIALSTTMILGVERVRVETRESFTNTIAGTDLIVGARTSPLQLLLYSVFRIGDATNNVSWQSFEKIIGHPSVAWAIPVSLGDSHRGFRVLGTTHAYFEHMRFGADRQLSFAAGGYSEDPLSVVIGAGVARELSYQPGSEIVIAHGTRDDGLTGHDNLPFTVSGVLEITGTPADRTVHVTLEGIEAIHVGWESGARIDTETLEADHVHEADLHTETITAFFIGLKQRGGVLQFQRAINNFPDEPLLAILPGNALSELWRLFANAELALIAVAAMTVVTGLLGMIVGIFSTLNERRREMAIMRSVGARPIDIFALLLTESAVIGGVGAVAGYLLLTAVSLAASAFAGNLFGLQISSGLPTTRECLLLLMIVVAALLAGGLPAWRAYRLSLHDGLNAS
jgi:putative ABC transport system permease protein